MSFEPLDFRNPDALERAVLDEWRAEGLFRQTLETTREGEPFVFYEGPPTANGRPGIHHVFARTIKDLVCRYHTMLGRSVTRIAGWDTHGLPVEIEVEKALGISGKREIERFGVAEFNARCRESVFRYKSDWESLSERIGYWLDYERPYITYTKEYIESVWWLLKQLHERDFLYVGHKVLPYCARCGTSLSSHELAMGYEAHRSPSIYVLFRVKGEVDRHLLVWTTTPWTLPSNVAIAVNPRFRYVELDVRGRRIIVEWSIADELVVPGATGGQRLAEFPRVAEYSGSELIGWEYEQLLNAVAVEGKAFEVVAGDFVTSDEGTGLVHMAPAFGADDFATIQREEMAFVNPVNEEGRFVGTAWHEINGLTVFEANPVVAERLEREGKVFGRYQPQGYEHQYPYCWRCSSPLIYYARRSWFVRTTAYSDRMIVFNRAIDWRPPEVGEGRFGEWLENNVDWALSRDRYWGTPLPVWECELDDAHRRVMGSFAELEEYLGRPLPEDFDPHKPFIDAYDFPCREPGCGGTMRRVPQVIDAWFDSGAMPYAQWHYPFENEEAFRHHFPADFICEGLDQTRGWFYSLLAIAAGVSDSTAYRHVIVNGLVLDAEGRKMSKRLGNVVNPWDAVGQYGADAVRLYLLASSQVGLPKRFDPKAIPEVALGFLTRLRNTYGFFALYAEDWSPNQAPPPGERPAVDRWLLSRLDRLVEAVREAWSAYDVTTGTRAIIAFCDDDLSNWYVRVNRARFWAPDSEADPAALATLHEALVTVQRLLAPAAPFVSDAIHRRLVGSSVHVTGFPEVTGMRDGSLEAAMDAVRQLVSLARSARERVNLRVRQPLATMRVAVSESVRGPAFDSFLELLAREVNVKALEVVETDAELVRLAGKPNYRALGKAHGSETPAVAALASELSQEQLRALERGESVRLVASSGRSLEYHPEEVLVEREVLTDWLVASQGPLVAALDPELTPELVQEGMAREIVNRVQRLRKEAGYDYNTRIDLSLSGDGEVLAAARRFEDFVAGETLARRLESGSDIDRPDVRQEVEIDGHRVVVSMRRHEDEIR
ncbi:MAG: isoleucine--tRNA ligase [Gemmatimonadales bacterium]